MTASVHPRLWQALSSYRVDEDRRHDGDGPSHCGAVTVITTRLSDRNRPA
ncbi:hypothetical protein GGR61_003429 [Xanthomonas arboricola]|nr:hypothetical protein [Xanthomonas sp. 3058]